MVPSVREIAQGSVNWYNHYANEFAVPYKAEYSQSLSCSNFIPVLAALFVRKKKKKQQTENLFIRA